MRPLLIYTSRTGNTESFAKFIEEQLDVDVGNFNSDISKYDNIILGTYTWGEGKIPYDMKQFLIKNQDQWNGKKIFIFGSGLTIYPKFCQAVNNTKKIVTDCGAEVTGFFKYEQRFKQENYRERFLSRMIDKMR